MGKEEYSAPDMTQWPQDPAREELFSDFDSERYRAVYNDWMAPEQPALSNIGDWRGVFPTAEAIVRKHHIQSVLDIGCGNGRYVISLLAQGLIETGTGIDISDVMVDNAIQTALNHGIDARFIRVPIEEFNPDCKYDLIIATEILEHIYYLRSGLAHMADLLTSDGFLCGATPLEHVCDAIVHLHYFTEASLRKLLGSFFHNVDVKQKDYTGEGEIHLIFDCSLPIRKD